MQECRVARAQEPCGKFLVHDDLEGIQLEFKPELPAPEYSSSVARNDGCKVVSLEGDAIDLANVIRALNDPTTLAVQLHGSRKAQNMLSQVRTETEMAAVQNVCLPPVVVLVTGNKGNNRECANFLLGVWMTKQGLVGYQQQHLNCNWFVSNRTSAVSLRAIDVEVSMEDLPAGCGKSSAAVPLVPSRGPWYDQQQQIDRCTAHTVADLLTHALCYPLIDLFVQHDMWS